MNNYIELINSLDTYTANDRHRPIMNELIETLLKEVVNSIKLNIKYEELQYLEENQRNIYKEISKYNLEDAEIHKIFSLAYMKAILDITALANNEFLKDENSTRLLKSHKHLTNLIESLYNENSLTHQELADRMNVSKGNLSNFINKPEIKKLITRNRYRKNVYYSISGDGYKLYKHIAIEKTKHINIETYTEVFIKMIDSIQTEINSEYVNPTRFWNNFVSEEEENIIFTKSNTVRNKLNKLIETVNRQKPYNCKWHSVSVKFIGADDKNKITRKLVQLNSKGVKGDLYECYK